MSTPGELSAPARNLLLVSLLSSDKIISNNAKGFLKELILRRDPKISDVLENFENKLSSDSNFVEALHNLIEAEASALYAELFHDTSLEVGKTLSKGERDTNDLNHNKSLIYGEVDFTSFYKVLRKIQPVQGCTFYDLGSGTGKALFVARMTQDFGRCIGIEILESLHSQATRIIERYNRKFRNVLSVGIEQNAAVYHGSFLEYDWSDGDIVFANSTCYDDSLMNDLSKMAERLKPGAIVITFTKGLENNKFEVLERKRYRMSWGPATVYIQRRLNADGSSVGPANLCILPVDNIPYMDNDGDISSMSATGNYITNDTSPQPSSGESSDNDDDETDSSETNDESDYEESKSENDYQMKTTDETPIQHSATSLNSQNAPFSPPIRINTGPGLLRGYKKDYMNSPQDSELLKRKRAAQVAHPIV